MSVLEQMEKDGNAVKLATAKDYEAYFAHLQYVFAILSKWYSAEAAEGNTEAKTVNGFLEKLLYTVTMLWKKNQYEEEQTLRLDLNESGFPHAQAIIDIDGDLTIAKDRLNEIPPRTALQEQMLDHMFKTLEEPVKLLELMGERRYLKDLDPARLFLQFTPGELEVRGKDERVRSYVFSWACYDYTTNVPYIHILAFEQDVKAEPLENKGQAWLQFLDVVKREGSRVPTCQLLASEIDRGIVHVHPKMLKRIKVGPILSPKYSTEKDILIECLKRWGDEGDFILLLDSEVVISEREEKVKTGLAGFLTAEKKIQQIFLIPQTDLDCLERRCSAIYGQIVIPHSVSRYIEIENDPLFKAHRNRRRIVYSKEGEIHGI